MCRGWCSEPNYLLPMTLHNPYISYYLCFYLEASINTYFVSFVHIKDPRGWYPSYLISIGKSWSHLRQTFRTTPRVLNDHTRDNFRTPLILPHLIFLLPTILSPLPFSCLRLLFPFSSCMLHMAPIKWHVFHNRFSNLTLAY